MTPAIHPYLFELESIERGAWTDLIAAMPEPVKRETGLQLTEIHHALFLMATHIPMFEFNRLCGAGLNGDDGRSIAEAVQQFRSAGQHKFFIQLAPGPNIQACEAQARAAGLKEHPLAWAKFYRTTALIPDAHTSLTVNELTSDERKVFGTTAAAGFGMSAPMAEWLSNLVGRKHWHTYVSFAEGEPAGAAALYVNGAFAWLGVGSTRPTMRKRGSQSALLARRLRDAAKLGAKHATAETGVPQPGQTAPSYTNILRAGFNVAYVRPNWSE